MPRPHRPEEPGAYFHITTGATSRSPLFVHDGDRCVFLLELADVVARMGWRCLTYCLMTTHYHLLVQTPQANLASGMQRLNGRYAEGFNGRHSRRGHAFGGRYWAEPITREAHLMEALRYIALNPVRAGVVGRAEAWRWSAHRALVDPAPTPTWLALGDTLALFGGGGALARRRYAAFVEEGLLTTRTSARSRRA